MIGKESVEASPKEINNYLVNYEETVDNLIFLDKEQQEALLKLNGDNPKIRNFAFKGPFGSGKTTLAIKCCNKLIDKYLSQGEEKIFVYAIANNEYMEEMILTSFLKDNIIPCDGRVFLKCARFSEIKNELNMRSCVNTPTYKAELQK